MEGKQRIFHFVYVHEADRFYKYNRKQSISKKKKEKKENKEHEQELC